MKLSLSQTMASAPATSRSGLWFDGSDDKVSIGITGFGVSLDISVEIFLNSTEAQGMILVDNDSTGRVCRLPASRPH